MQTKFKLAVASLLLAVPTLVALSTSSKQYTKVQAEPIVYICTGSKAYTYHKTNRCRGLNRCSGNVVAVSLSKAKQMDRRPCKLCY